MSEGIRRYRLRLELAGLGLVLSGALTEGEMMEMRRHSRAGFDLVAGVGLDDIAMSVLYLHER